MFPRIVSSLSLSPAASTQLAYYARRLRGERLTRQLSAVMAGGLMLLQLATVVAPATNVNANSPNNDIGSINTTHPQATLVSMFENNPEIRDLYRHFGITLTDIKNTHHTTIHSSSYWLSLGRQRHSADDKVVQVGNNIYYQRPLDQVALSKDFPALYGTKASDGQPFAVLIDCGNIELAAGNFSPPPPPSKPAPPPPSKPQPAPVTPTTPPAPPTVTPNPTPVIPPPPVTPGQPHLVLSKTATIVAADGTQRASNAEAQAGDTIIYSLNTTNDGTEDALGYVVHEQMADVLEYSTFIGAAGGTLDPTTQSVSWPARKIKHGETYTVTIQVRVKSPIPSTPVAQSDPQSFDLRMDNVYGNLVQITLPPSTPGKQIEMASQPLPQTGAATNTIVMLIFISVVMYFYFRNRQLLREVTILRHDHHGGVN